MKVSHIHNIIEAAVTINWSEGLSCWKTLWATLRQYVRRATHGEKTIMDTGQYRLMSIKQCHQQHQCATFGQLHCRSQVAVTSGFTLDMDLQALLVLCRQQKQSITGLTQGPTPLCFGCRQL